MSADLTDKQAKFLSAYRRLGNASEAYRRAYDADGMSDATVHREASALLAHPKIAERLSKPMSAKANSAPTLKSAGGANIAVEMWPISKIKPYEKNPRAINDRAVSKVAVSIREYGWQQPIVVDKAGVVIVGHTRLKAAEMLGLAEVPVKVANLSEEKTRAYRLADNRTHEETDWLEALLADELNALKELDFDLSLTGFDERELDKLLMDDAELARAEETPPVPENPVTVKGDVWVMGKHRLVCGDSTIATDVDKALNGVKPHLCVTDPPYGVNYDPNWRNEADRANGKPYGARAVGKVENDDRADWTEAYALFPGDVIYVWHPAGARQVEFFNSLGGGRLYGSDANHLGQVALPYRSRRLPCPA